MVTSYLAWVRLGIVVVAVWLLIEVTPVYLPLVLATVLAFVLKPLVNVLRRIKLGPKERALPHGVAIVLAFVIFGLVMAGVVSYILLPFLHEFNKFLANLPELMTRLRQILDTVIERTNMVHLPPNMQNLLDQALSSAAALTFNVVRKIINATVNLATQLVELIVVPVLAYYFLKDANTLKTAVTLPFPAASRRKVRLAIDEISDALSAYVRGQVVVSIIVGFLVFVGMYVMKVEYPLILGLLAAITETIPIVGPIIGAIPAIILAYIVSPVLALKVTIFYIVIQQLENHIIFPKIMGANSELHPVVIIISLLIGGQLLGIVGMWLAVPVVAVLRVVLKYLWNDEE